MRTYGCHRLIIQRCLRALTGTHFPINYDFQEILKMASCFIITNSWANIASKQGIPVNCSKIELGMNEGEHFLKK